MNSIKIALNYEHYRYIYTHVNVIKGDTEDLTKSRNLCTEIIQNLSLFF